MISIITYQFKDDPENILKTRDAENVAIGVCVNDNDAKCPNAAEMTLSMANCRPGAIGILVSR
jgi:hypothetical protein